MTVIRIRERYRACNCTPDGPSFHCANLDCLCPLERPYNGLRRVDAKGKFFGNRWLFCTMCMEIIAAYPPLELVMERL